MLAQTYSLARLGVPHGANHVQCDETQSGQEVRDTQHNAGAAQLHSLADRTDDIVQQTGCPRLWAAAAAAMIESFREISTLKPKAL